MDEEVAVREPMTSGKKSRIGTFKKKFAIKKELVPLKFAIFLFYGGNEIVYLSYISFYSLYHSDATACMHLNPILSSNNRYDK